MGTSLFSLLSIMCLMTWNGRIPFYSTTIKALLIFQNLQQKQNSTSLWLCLVLMVIGWHLHHCDRTGKKLKLHLRQNESNQPVWKYFTKHCWSASVWFRESLVDPAPWWICHDPVGSSRQLDQAKQASNHAYNFLPLHHLVQNMGHAECSDCLCVRVAVSTVWLETVWLLYRNCTSLYRLTAKPQ